MIKSLVISLVFLGSVAAQAAPVTYTTIGWGRDGATARPFPSKNSVQMAAEVYSAMGGTGDELVFESEEFAIEASQDGINITIMNNVEDIKLSKNEKSQIDVRLQGSIAKFLYESIKTPAIAAVGATNKKAGNVACAKGLQSGGKVAFQCSIHDVMAMQMDGQ